jgi:hypothetical protein
LRLKYGSNDDSICAISQKAPNDIRPFDKDGVDDVDLLGTIMANRAEPMSDNRYQKGHLADKKKSTLDVNEMY